MRMVMQQCHVLAWELLLPDDLKPCFLKVPGLETMHLMQAYSSIVSLDSGGGGVTLTQTETESNELIRFWCSGLEVEMDMQ